MTPTELQTCGRWALILLAVAICGAIWESRHRVAADLVDHEVRARRALSAGWERVIEGPAEYR